MTCVAEAPPKSAGACPSAGQGAGNDPNKPNPCPPGNPINPLTGNKYQIETDYAGASTYPLRFERYYNSNTGIGGGRIGARWRHTFDRSISVSGANATVSRPDGKKFVFTQSGANWVAPADVMDRLTQTETGWTYTAAPNDEVETYDASGRLVSIANRPGVAHTLGYDGSGRLATVTHSLSSRTLTFSYDGANRIVSMTDPAGKVFSHAYANGNLSSVTFPDDTESTTDNPVRTYVYNELANTSGANFPAHLTGIVDENASRFTTYQYAADGRAISTERSGAVSAYSVAYNVDGTSTVTDPLSTARIYGAQTVQDVPRHTSVNQPCDRCGLAASISYDTSGYLSGATNFNGIAFTYVHDARGLETSRTEAAGTPQARTITTQWHPSFRLPTLITEPGRATSFDYDTSGNLLTKTVTDTALGSSRTWTHTYNSAGQVLSVNGPRTDVVDVTSYTYYANDDLDLGKRGNLASVTNALGHVTQITAYNAHGQPLSITDPNGLVTTLTYDARQRLMSRNVGGETTTYDYDGVGQLTKITLPDGSLLTYTYDPAHRLTVITDALGNRISYTLDAMGNRTQEQVLDPLGALKQTRSRVFNSLNRLFQELGAAAQVTEYGYDNQGNLTQTIYPNGDPDPLGNQRDMGYDALNRLTSVTDPKVNGARALTQYGYDGIDQLTSVTDPRGLVTSYTLTGLGDMTQQVSPDTGTTSNSVFDAAGNLKTSADARGITATYTYDALNRATRIDYSDATVTTYTWDSPCANGKGRLCSTTHVPATGGVSTTAAWTYDQKGRVTRRDETAGTVTGSTQYAYDPTTGRLAAMTYPTGTVVSYSYDLNGRVNGISTGGSPLLSNITYFPFGRPAGWTWGNGTAYTRGFDLDGRIASYTLGSQSFAVGFDPASRITSISEVGIPANTNTYGYDGLDRLTQAVLPATPFAYGYDAVGNRLAKTAGANSDTYAYPGTSNRLSSITPATGPVRSYAYDNAGNVTADGLNTYAYDARGRLSSTTAAGFTSSLHYNGLGQRTHRSPRPGLDVAYAYDEAGRLITEFTSDSASGDNYGAQFLYVDGVAAAAVWFTVPAGQPVQQLGVFNVHPDHLDTPRLVTDSLDRAWWRWDVAEPFGANPANENPQGLGVFPFNLRFPGQYFDKETNLHYNYFRDYDPSIGRYVQSDPIGLRGGLNMYVYVDAAPTIYADPSGLQSKFFPRKRQLIDKALQELPDTWCDYWPASCYKDALICLEARCTKTDSCGRKYTYIVDSWIPRNPPRNDPGKDCVCTRWTLNRGE